MKSNTLKSTQFFTTKTLTSLSLLTTLSIILARVLGVIIPIAGLPALKINFSSIPLMVSGIIFGPAAGFVSGTIADIIGYMINSGGGAFFPGFTLSNALTGMIPGLIFKLIKTGRLNTKANYNIFNSIFIALISAALVGAFYMKGVLTFDNGVFYNGNEVNTIYVVLFLLLAIFYVILPLIISKYVTNKSTLYSFDKIYFTVGITQVITSVFLNTYFLSILFGKGVLVFLPTRIITNYIMIPLFSIILIILINIIGNQRSEVRS